jgi:hypothetical protein
MEEYKNAEEEQALPNNQQQLITNKNGGCWMSNSMKEEKKTNPQYSTNVRRLFYFFRVSWSVEDYARLGYY